MSWDNAPPFVIGLSRQLDSFGWAEAAAICDYIIERIGSEPEPMPEEMAKKCLAMLRRKRRFRLMAQLAEALIRSGQRAPQIKRQYAQALIDQGILLAPESVLQSIIQDSQDDSGEGSEARGLLGRIYKQLYVNNRAGRAERNRIYLERALNEYLYVYRLAPQEHLWHGINGVALLALAQRDGLSRVGLPNPIRLAKRILATLAAREERSGALEPWDMATRIEALVALGRFEKAEARALEYAAHPRADAFEFASTLRQLIEVWQLDDKTPPGSRLLTICRAALLRREGSVLKIEPRGVLTELANINETRAEPEKGSEGFSTTLGWYKDGLTTCEAVARVENRDGRGHGTGLLVNATDFFPESKGGVLLLTNAHLVSRAPFPTALRPDKVVINFQMLGEKCAVENVVWSSPPGELDAALLLLKGEKPSATPLRVGTLRRAGPDDSPQRLYLVGHEGDADPRFNLKSGARGESFEFQDTHLTMKAERSLRYRTPVRGGSSGSALFDPEDWSVVALHHSGRSGAGGSLGERATHVNEGTSISAIQSAARRLSGNAIYELLKESDPIVIRKIDLDRELARDEKGVSFEVTMPVDEPTATGADVSDKMPSGAQSSAAGEGKGPEAERKEARFHFTLEGKAVRGRFVQYGTDVDLIFKYALPRPDALVVITEAVALDKARVSETPLGILLAPVGFKFRKEGDAGVRVMNFYDSGRSADEVRFELRAADAPPTPESEGPGEPEADIPPAPPASGFHVIFEVGGSLVYQFFMPAQLVPALPEPWDDDSPPPPLELNLDQLKGFGEHAAAARRRMDEAVEEVLSNA